MMFEAMVICLICGKILQKLSRLGYNEILNTFAQLTRIVKPFLFKTAKIRQKFLRKNFFNRLGRFPSHVVCVIHVDIQNCIDGIAEKRSHGLDVGAVG